MLSKIKSYGLRGIEGYAVDIEVDVNNGLPGTELVGLGDTAVKEAKERVRSAVKNSGYQYSPKKITVNLAPADIRKEGTFYDLGIALGILYATEQISPLSVSDYIIIGELSLDGKVRRVSGLLPTLISAAADGHKKFILPFENRNEAAYIGGIEIYAVENLKEAVGFLTGQAVINPSEHKKFFNSDSEVGQDFKYLKGQYMARRAAEIAAAGGHNILLIGPPGAGKTMLARCFPTILPDFTAEEALETTKIHSVAGILNPEEGIIRHRPFRSPHHTVSKVALSGGGTNARPGEMSLAHNGVLFLDELPEYSRDTLENLRQPLEDGYITVSRASKSVIYPASFMLVASMNPCPCGYYGSKVTECSCTPFEIKKYRAKLSGPLLDRIDLHINVSEVKYEEISGGKEAESSADIRKRVNAARNIQLNRLTGSGIYCNAKMNAEMISRFCHIDCNGEKLLKSAFEQMGMSARSYGRILKVARTIADLAGNESIAESHIREALQYRILDKRDY